MNSQLPTRIDGCIPQEICNMEITIKIEPEEPDILPPLSGEDVANGTNTDKWSESEKGYDSKDGFPDRTANCSLKLAENVSHNATYNDGSNPNSSESDNKHSDIKLELSEETSNGSSDLSKDATYNDVSNPNHSESGYKRSDIKFELSEETSNGSSDLSKDATTYDVSNPNCLESGNKRSDIKLELSEETSNGSSDLAESLTCPTCEKQFSTDRRLMIHMKLNTGFHATCPVCDKVFTAKSRMLKHAKKHKENALYDCVLCKMKFQQRKELSTHVGEEHTVPYPHECQLCGENNYDRHVYEKHIFRHSRKNVAIDSVSPHCPVKCKICGLYFGKSSIKIHEKKHQIGLHLTCALCVKDSKSNVFRAFVSLRHHIINFHSKKFTNNQFKCEICGVMLTQIGAYCQHIASHSVDARVMRGHLHASDTESFSWLKVRYISDVYEEKYSCPNCRLLTQKHNQVRKGMAKRLRSNQETPADHDTWSDLISHIKETHLKPGGPYDCALCGEVLPCVDDFFRHLLTHRTDLTKMIMSNPKSDGSGKPIHAAKPYPCVICKMQTGKSEQYLTHSLKKHIEMTHTKTLEMNECPICEEVLFTVTDFCIHIMMKHRPEDMDIKCQVEVVLPKESARPVETNIGIDRNERLINKVYPCCALCKYPIRTQKRSDRILEVLYNHIVDAHTNPNQTSVCSLCGAEFDKVSKFCLHVAQHSCEVRGKRKRVGEGTREIIHVIKHEWNPADSKRKRKCKEGADSPHNKRALSEIDDMSDDEMIDILNTDAELNQLPPSVSLDMEVEQCVSGEEVQASTGSTVVAASILAKEKCPFCGKVFTKSSTKRAIATHIWSHGKGLLACVLCRLHTGTSKQFSRMKVLEHVERAHAKLYEPNECQICEKVFFTPESFCSHVVLKHNEKDVEDRKAALAEYSVSVESCTEQDPNDQAIYKYPYCALCHCRFLMKKNKLKHIYRHIEEDHVKSNQTNVCELCGAEFSKVSKFCLHITHHSRQRVLPKQRREEGAAEIIHVINRPWKSKQPKTNCEASTQNSRKNGGVCDTARNETSNDSDENETIDILSIDDEVPGLEGQIATVADLGLEIDDTVGGCQSARSSNEEVAQSLIVPKVEDEINYLDAPLLEIENAMVGHDESPNPSYLEGEVASCTPNAGEEGSSVCSTIFKDCPGTFRRPTAAILVSGNNCPPSANARHSNEEVAQSLIVPKVEVEMPALDAPFLVNENAMVGYDEIPNPLNLEGEVAPCIPKEEEEEEEEGISVCSTILQDDSRTFRRPSAAILVSGNNCPPCTQSADRPFKCFICEDNFASEEEILEHIKIHNEEDIGIKTETP